jgi:hypothetical protein
MTIHEIDAREVEDDVLFCFREPLDVGPDIIDETCVEVSV